MSSTPVAEPAAFKAAMTEEWDRAAAGWNRHTPHIRTWLRSATDAMLAMAGVAPGLQVLDVAAGAGDQTLDLLSRVGPEGGVVATDLSPVILALARQNAEAAGHRNLRTEVADGEKLPLAGESVDAVVCRLGLMFFPDPLQGVREMHRVLRPGGRVCSLVFSRPERNPCVGILMSTALAHAGLPPRDPFAPGGLLSLGKPGLADEIFRAAGFRDVATTAVDAPFRLPAVRDYLEFVRASASPVRALLGRLAPDAAAAAWADIEARLGVFTTPEGWIGPNELLLTNGRK